MMVYREKLETWDDVYRLKPEEDRHEGPRDVPDHLWRDYQAAVHAYAIASIALDAAFGEAADADA